MKLKSTAVDKKLLLEELIIKLILTARELSMLKVKEAVIVEGKYDKIKLSNLLDALIIETNGFSVYKDKKKLAFIKSLQTSVV